MTNSIKRFGAKGSSKNKTGSATAAAAAYCLVNFVGVYIPCKLHSPEGKWSELIFRSDATFAPFACAGCWRRVNIDQRR